MDALLEAKFNLDPWNGMDEMIFEEFDPANLFRIESEAFENEILMEASNATKGNVFTKLMNIIKKAVKFIGKIIMKIVNGIKKIFGVG